MGNYSSNAIEQSIYFFGKPNHKQTISAANALRDLPYLYFSENELETLAGFGIYVKHEKYPYVFVFVNDGNQPRSKLLSSLKDITAWAKRQDPSQFIKPTYNVEEIITTQASTFDSAQRLMNSKKDFYNVPTLILEKTPSTKTKMICSFIFCS